MGQKSRQISSYGDNANGGYFRQCGKLIRDQNQHHCNHTMYRPIGAVIFFHFTRFQLSPHNMTLIWSQSLLMGIDLCFRV